MYDLIGRLEGIGETYGQWKEIKVREFCGDLREDNAVVMRLSPILLETSGARPKDWVKIRFVLEGRTWNGKMFNNVVCRKIKVLEKDQPEEVKHEEPIPEEISEESPF